TAICSRSTNSRDGTGSRAAAAPTSAFNTPLSSIGADRSSVRSANRTSCSATSIYMLTTRYRFDHDTMNLRQFEAEAVAAFDRFQFSALYGNYDAQPQLGFLTRREGILGTARLKLTQNWV